MRKAPEEKYTSVDASPVKDFFVRMLTRDIKLEEAILDLLDNCVDGILRQQKNGRAAKPYAGFSAQIEFNRDSFLISDNCGGIPWSLHEYAFRMGPAPGRPRDTPGTVGVYGIGMKRAIFKMGRECLLSTRSGKDSYEVEILPEWIENEKEWHIPVRPARKTMAHDGTTILIGSLYSMIAARFSDDAVEFDRLLRDMVATHYAFIIDKGFEVSINGKVVVPRPTKLVFARGDRRSERIQPFIFKGELDGVEIFLAVGFTRPLPSEAEIAAEQEDTKYSSLAAGWTVLCNDRAVLYCDRTELTGWGEAGVARYHTQFIAISGIVEFRSADPSKLPTTTTKRGIDAASPLYLRVKNKMREGMKLFIDYTNWWRGRLDEAKKHIEGEVPVTFHEVKAMSETLRFTATTKTILPGQQYKPRLPSPKSLEPKKRRISFLKNAEEVETVAEHLFEDRETDPSEVGERCFEIILGEAEA